MRNVVATHLSRASLVASPLACLLACLVGTAPNHGCAAMQRTRSGSAADGQLPSQVLSGSSDEPALYLSAAQSSPVLGFLGRDALLDVLGPSQEGRVPVRVRGPMQVRAFVPASLLQLRTQRHGRLRGTPVYLGPDDAVRVVGKGEKADRVRVRAAPRVGALTLPAFEGTYPAVGLAARRAADDAAKPPAGEPYVLPANTALELRETAAGKVVVLLPAQSEASNVRVLREQNGWFAVRIGDGPYLVGYTNARLLPGEADAVTRKGAEGSNSSGKLPRRLADESGDLQQVAVGAKVSFDGRVIARLDKPGYARVLATYPSGEADALVAVDDSVTVRGLVQTRDLSTVGAQTERSGAVRGSRAATTEH